MSEPNATGPRPDWQARNLRVTAFPVDAPSHLDRDWWEALFGTRSEAETRRRDVRLAEGEYGGHGLRLLADPIRIQLDLHPRDPEELVDELLDLGPFRPATDTLTDLARRFFEIAPPLDRVAFGAILRTRVNTREEGYVLLDGLLPAVTVDPTSSDLQYQINRPRPSQSLRRDPPVNINRLTQWVVGKVEHRLVVGNAGTEPEVARFCQLSLDVNTAPTERLVFEAGELEPLWNELVGFAFEISKRGDQP